MIRLMMDALFKQANTGRRIPPACECKVELTNVMQLVN